MSSDDVKQRRKGAEMIVERCKQLAQELGEDLQGIEWEEDIEEASQSYTLRVRVESGSGEIKFSGAELKTYCSNTDAQVMDAKLKSVIEKRY
jgi:hypothetical protein